MTIRSMFAAATLSLGLVLAPAAFAMDAMGKDDGMKHATDSKMSSPMSSPMSKDTMGKDTTDKSATEGMGMKKDGMSDTKSDTSGGMKK